MMNRPEFLRGWLLLTAQPWGRTYRSDNTNPLNPEPSPAKIQCELYFKALCYAYVPAWLEVAELLAAGEKWPSITECKEALRHAKAKPTVPVIEMHEAGWITQEEFGVDLYEIVKIIAMMKDAPDSPQLKDKLTTLMRRLPDADVAEILQRYPMVGTL